MRPSGRSADDKTKWVFKLRSGAKFHDGSPVNAAAIVWNVQKVLDKAAPHFDPSQVGVTASRMPTLRSARAIDEMTVELTTSEPDAFLPINLTNLFMASPTHWDAKLKAVPASVSDPAERSKQAWTAFAADPSGSGPFRVTRFVAARAARACRQSRLLGREASAEDPARRALCRFRRQMPAPPPSCPGRSTGSRRRPPTPSSQIKSRGFTLYQNAQPHVWPWQLSFAEGSPWLDKRVRHAANLCVNRSELKEALNGLMAEATATYEEGHPWNGNPSFKIKYDPATAKKLMTEAGFSASKPLKVKVQTSASGSGQMMPIPMNEYVQQALKECFFDVELDVIEWNTLFTNWRQGAKDASARGANAINVTYAAMDPFFGMVRFTSTKAFPPVSNNWGYFGSDEFDTADRRRPHEFRRQGARYAALAKLHARIVEEAPFIWIAHDVGPARHVCPR